MVVIGLGYLRLEINSKHKSASLVIVKRPKTGTTKAATTYEYIQ